MSDKNQKSDCCPEFNPVKYHKKEFEFKDKLFVKDKIFSIFHFPLNFGSVMAKATKKIEAAGAQSDDFLYFTDESSLFGTPLYIAVSKEVPDANMEKLSGKFLTKVFEGPYKEMGKFAKKMKEYVEDQTEALEKMYFYYPYCPKCAKKYKKNYVVIFAQLRHL